jgi:hypothetical protein
MYTVLYIYIYIMPQHRYRYLCAPRCAVLYTVLCVERELRHVQLRYFTRTTYNKHGLVGTMAGKGRGKWSRVGYNTIYQ